MMSLFRFNLKMLGSIYCTSLFKINREIRFFSNNSKLAEGNERQSAQRSEKFIDRFFQALNLNQKFEIYKSEFMKQEDKVKNPSEIENSLILFEISKIMKKDNSYLKDQHYPFIHHLINYTLNNLKPVKEISLGTIIKNLSDIIFMTDYSLSKEQYTLLVESLPEKDSIMLSEMYPTIMEGLCQILKHIKESDWILIKPKIDLLSKCFLKYIDEITIDFKQIVIVLSCLQSLSKAFNFEGIPSKLSEYIINCIFVKDLSLTEVLQIEFLSKQSNTIIDQSIINYLLKNFSEPMLKEKPKYLIAFYKLKNQYNDPIFSLIQLLNLLQDVCEDPSLEKSFYFEDLIQVINTFCTKPNMRNKLLRNLKFLLDNSRCVMDTNLERTRYSNYKKIFDKLIK